MDRLKRPKGKPAIGVGQRCRRSDRRCALLALVAAAAGCYATFTAPEPRRLPLQSSQGRHGCATTIGRGQGRLQRVRRSTVARRADLVGGLSLPDFGEWWEGISSALVDFAGKFAAELAPGLAFWAAPAISLTIVVVAFGLASRRKVEEDFGFVDEEDSQSMDFMGGGGKPKLTIRSWSRQIDRFSQTVTRATQGLEMATKLRRDQEEAYKRVQRLEAAAARNEAKKKRKEKEEAQGKQAKKEAKSEESSQKSGKDADVKPEMKRVWVLRFGAGRNDIGASGVEQLREEITAVVLAADPKRDEVVVRLDSPGGTVTGYGLAGAQLIRLRDAGLHVTVAIDQVAASGGYLMACTANRIIASNFAVIGSIGVVQELPNLYERLKREGINFETTTAGKYKRTLTPFKEPTDEDRQRVKEDLADVLGVFKDFVSSSRPSVDIEAVATGETWLGPLALKRGLVDDLMTSDALLLGFAREGRQVLEVSFESKARSPLQQLLASAPEALVALFLGSRPGPPGAFGGVPPPLAKAGVMPAAWSGLAEPRDEEPWGALR